MHAGTNATSPLSNAVFMVSCRLTRELGPHLISFFDTLLNNQENGRQPRIVASGCGRQLIDAVNTQ